MGGLDAEALKAAFSEGEFCLRVRGLAATRGDDMSPEKKGGSLRTCSHAWPPRRAARQGSYTRSALITGGLQSA